MQRLRRPPRAFGARHRLARELPANDVEVYYNTLWLQDPERWAGLQGMTLS